MTTQVTTNRAAIYVRLSVSKDTSVSIERQRETCETEAAKHGWTVAGVWVDDGVSASKNAPEAREAWQAMMAAQDSWDVVIILKLDRAVRRIVHFWQTHKWLDDNGKALVSVEDKLDMTTTMGQMMAGLLAGGAQMEAEAISTRVTAARSHLLTNGRVVGGTVPFGWKKIPNPNPEGKGFVLARDPERIDWVRRMTERALRGDSIYSIVRWLESTGAPLPTASQKKRKYEGRWSYSTVERLLRNPILAGMKAYQPGRGRHEPRASTAVLRGSDGLPVVDADIAILTPERRRDLLARLDDRPSPQSRPRASKNVTSPLLAGLATCATCARTMHRGTTQGRPSLSCPSCYMVISRTQLDAHLANRLLSERGGLPLWTHEEIRTDNAAELANIEEAIRDIATMMTTDGVDMPALAEQLNGLKTKRAKARAGRPSIRRWRASSRTVREAWEACATDEERRSVLLANLSSLRIRRGRVGRHLDPERVLVAWIDVPDGKPLPDGLRRIREVTETLEGVEGEVGAVVVNLPDGTTMYTPRSGSPPRHDEHL